MSQDELQQRIDDELEALQAQLSEGKSERFVELLNFWASFHNYSFNNCLLIHLQRPDATRVASYKVWQQVGRQVREGARSIKIYAPRFGKRIDLVTAEETQVLVGFVKVSVFAAEDLVDIATNPLPSLFERLQDDAGELLEYLVEQVEECNIPVIFQAHGGGILGTSDGHRITIDSRLPSRNQVAVLIHELAHHESHWDDDRPNLSKTVKETEAEAVSHVICRLMGFENPGSPDYLLLYNADVDVFKSTLGRIQKTLRDVLNIIDLKQAPQPIAA